MWLHRIIVASLLLAFSVILLGAYTRLSDAGLGCPDWPGCYGQLTAPTTSHEIQTANSAFPDMPVDSSKAKKEMTHRYFAESLGFLIVCLAAFTFVYRKKIQLPLWLPMLLVALVIAQGILGMWTVTLKLLPLVVMGHLIGGFCTLSLLWLCWLLLKFPTMPQYPLPRALSRLAFLCLGVLFFQIALGGWTSANYAALICPDFPLCQGKWLPDMSTRAFNVLGAIGIEEPLAFMDAVEKTTIHVSHRLGALFTFLLCGVLSFKLWQQGRKLPKQSRRLFIGCSHLLAGLLFIQIILGISNVVMHLPLHVAVTHNGIAVLLLLTLITINFILIKSRSARE
ncbi:MAG: COX15/CtaA family protein [Proteobacteria bacterium]|nr:COX15/CtaA family protein [Pseudomonadota bacterium]